MCGILCVFGRLPGSADERRVLLLKLSKRLRHRGEALYTPLHTTRI
jgi:hypothetical protein